MEYGTEFLTETVERLGLRRPPTAAEGQLPSPHPRPGLDLQAIGPWPVATVHRREHNCEHLHRAAYDVSSKYYRVEIRSRRRSPATRQHARMAGIELGGHPLQASAFHYSPTKVRTLLDKWASSRERARLHGTRSGAIAWSWAVSPELPWSRP